MLPYATVKEKLREIQFLLEDYVTYGAMPKSIWIERSLSDLPKNEELIQFLNNVYSYLSESQSLSERRGRTKSDQYKGGVFDLLYKAKERFPLQENELRNLQMEIEDLTIQFDEESIFKTVPNIIRMLINKNAVSAKDFLKGRELGKEDIELLSEFGQYTIEALIVHVLGMVFHAVEYNSLVRVASLVERLEYSVRMHASLLKSRRCKKPFTKDNEEMTDKGVKKSKLEKSYPLGSGLVQFMEQRELITLLSDLDGTVRVKKGDYYLPSHLYAICNFDLSLLPIKLNLPMVCKPLDWRSSCPEGQAPRNLSDLSGGYLSEPTGCIYDRYRLLTSGDINNFYIDLVNDDYKALCNVMNKLQGQAFQINSVWLRYIYDNKNQLVELGFLMPEFLAYMNIKEVSRILREFHMKDEAIKKCYSFSKLLDHFCKNIQRARYEQLILDLAIAYDGYQFYLPAFLDFRGRIYRSGILHFHERDLARSLLLLANSKAAEKNGIIAAIAFHYKPFDSLEEAINWIEVNLAPRCDISLEFAQRARRPYQFLANIIAQGNSNIVANLPITQDASASAYQIMSYFLMDETMAKRTNLIPSSDGKIQDVYAFFLEELIEFMKAELDEHLYGIVSEVLTRKLVKSIYMPIIYGKTLLSTAGDLRGLLSHYLTYKECFNVASVCFKFWRMKYHGMECLIRLIRDIGWIASACDRPVFYKTPYFTTVQDYMVMEPINIWVYDRIHKKRRRVTLRVSSSKRDRRKTEIATFVNFIHQKDAYIAMNVVEKMLFVGAPIYTVHDNFLTTNRYIDYIPNIYSCAIRDMGPPLSIINEFIYMNVIKPINKMESFKFKNDYFTSRVIREEILHDYLYKNIPENITKNMRAAWEERCTRILTSYGKYTRIVCGSKVSWEAHKLKWEKFQNKQRGGEGPYYCVHY